ncbi:Hypothetical_protein [Hexamita inflata]|uniref:Hypothetical_protein n=1 Tax=Hexamita inflata TaxID=28002 RepID=A0AA86PWM8_9EUKA|nr:Hypothetical protein HINF_LOCUS35390 [Hexamita inflata]
MVQASSGLQSSAKEVQNSGVQEPFKTFKLQIPMLRSQVSNADTAQKQERPVEQDAVQPLPEEKQQPGAKPSLVLTFEKPRYQEQSAITETFEEENREEVQDGTVDIDFLGEERVQHLDLEKPEERVQPTAEECSCPHSTWSLKTKDAQELPLPLPDPDRQGTQSADTTHNGTQPEETRAVEQSAPPHPEAKEQKAGSVNCGMQPEDQRETKNAIEGKEQLCLIINSNLSLDDEKIGTKIDGLEDKYNQLIKNPEVKPKSVLNDDTVEQIEVLKEQKLIINNSKPNQIFQSGLNEQKETNSQQNVLLKDKQQLINNPESILIADEIVEQILSLKEQKLIQNNSIFQSINDEQTNKQTLNKQTVLLKKTKTDFSLSEFQNAKQQLLLQNAPLHAKSKSKPLQIRKYTVKNDEFFSEITVLKQIAKPVIQNMFTTPIVQRKKIQQDSLYLNSQNIDLKVENSQNKLYTSQLQNNQQHNQQQINQSQNNLTINQMQIHQNQKQEIKELVSSQLETSDQTQVIRSYQSHTENLNEKQDENVLLKHEVLFTEQSSISVAQQPNNVEQKRLI